MPWSLPGLTCFFFNFDFFFFSFSFPLCGFRPTLCNNSTWGQLPASSAGPLNHMVNSRKPLNIIRGFAWCHRDSWAPGSAWPLLGRGGGGWPASLFLRCLWYMLSWGEEEWQVGGWPPEGAALGGKLAAWALPGRRVCCFCQPWPV